MIVNWVDVFDERQKLGLAVFSDHTTAYTHGPDQPLGLVMGWGWEGGFWWGKCPLRGTQQVSYAVLPHGGAWDEVRLSRESCCWNEPLLAQLMDVPRLMFRLFDAEGDATERAVSLDFRRQEAESRLPSARIGAPFSVAALSAYIAASARATTLAMVSPAFQAASPIDAFTDTFTTPEGVWIL